MGANAQTTVPTFTSGQVLTALQLNNSARTGVPVFATTADRDAAFGGAGEKTLAEGQMCYIEAAPKRFQVYDGSAWFDYDLAATTYTPALTNLTLGNGTLTGLYTRIGKIIYGSVFLKFGTTTSVSGLIGIGLPFTVAANQADKGLSLAVLGDVGVNTFWGVTIYTENTARVDICAQLVNGNYSAVQGTTATVPFTWGNTDEIYFNFTFRAA